MRKTLLLSASYEALSFINEKKVFKFLFKDKVDVISTWEEVMDWGQSKVKFPSILKLKSNIKRNFIIVNFSRKSLIKRDKSTCQYCGKVLTASQITVDHIIPKAQGGGTSFINCVICCQTCNFNKADKTPEQAGMKLIRRPVHPSFGIFYHVTPSKEHWHHDWDCFLK